MQSLFPLQSAKAIKSSFLAAAVLLAGCSSGGGSGDDASSGSPTNTPTQSASVVQGNAIKGAISNGLVSAYPVALQNGVLTRSNTAVADPVRTDEFGAYSLSLPSSNAGTIYVVEVTADGLTRMTCDVTAGCGVSEGGSAINFGDLFPLSNDFSLRGIAVIEANGQISAAHLSPLTHMAVARAESMPTGLTLENIEASRNYIETTFGLDSGALEGAVADITRLEQVSSFNETELEYGVVSAAILAAVNSPDWSSIEEVLDHVEQSLQSGADIPSVNMGALRAISLDDVFYQANEIASDIALTNPNAIYVTNIQAIVERTQTAYDEVAVSQDTPDPVSILSNPSDVQLDEGETASFSVTATGGGELSYQWRLDGQNISGATGSNLNVFNVDSTDAGVYDVIVSNSVGSVSSSPASLVVYSRPEEENGGENTGGSESGESGSEGDSEGSGSDNGGSDNNSGGQTGGSDSGDGSTGGEESSNEGESSTGEDSSSGEESSGGENSGNDGSSNEGSNNEENSGGNDSSNEEEQAQPEFVSVTLSWDIPNARADGSDLELYEISGYEVRYGESANDLSQVLSVEGASNNQATIDNLPLGSTYYFAIATRDSDGNLSAFSATSALFLAL